MEDATCLFPALLQKLVGELFFDFWEGNLAGNLAGPQNKDSKDSENISEHFS